MRTLVMATTRCVKCDNEVFRINDTILKKVYTHKCITCNEPLYEFETYIKKLTVEFEER